MRHLPCIPDEIISAEQRQRVYNYEQNSELIAASGQVVALVDPQQIAANYRELLQIIDALAGAYLNLSRERDQWKGAVELALDDRFWDALEGLPPLG